MGNRTSKRADQQFLLDDTDEEPLIEKISVVLMGCHGVGKNTIGNAILKKKAFRFHDRSKNYYLKDENTTFDRHVSVTRVPGWSADLNSEKNRQLWQVIRDSVRSVEDGPHVIILVVDMNTEPSETTKAKLKQLLDYDVFQHILIISVDARKIVVNHSARKQTIINRCKCHFLRCTCGKQNKKLIETIEDFIIYKHEIRFCSMRKKTPNLELQYQDLANLVDRLKRKLETLKKTLDSKDDKIRELQRVLKEKEDMLTPKEDMKSLNSYENPNALSVSHKMSEQSKHAAQHQKMEEEFQRKRREIEKQLEEKNEEIEKLKLKSKKEIEELKSKNNEEIEKLKSKNNEEIIKLKSKNNEEIENLKLKNNEKIEELRKEIQTLKSQNKNKKRPKPSSVPGPRQKDADSIELTSVNSAGVQFLKKYRKELTERIVALKPIADDLLQSIGHHKYEKILQAPNEYDQRRELCDIVDKGGKKLQVEFYECLKKHEKYLVEDLEESQ